MFVQFLVLSQIFCVKQSVRLYYKQIFFFYIEIENVCINSKIFKYELFQN